MGFLTVTKKRKKENILVTTTKKQEKVHQKIIIMLCAVTAPDSWLVPSATSCSYRYGPKQAINSNSDITKQSIFRLWDQSTRLFSSVLVK